MGCNTAPAVDVTVSDDETPSAAVALTASPGTVDEDAGATTIEVTGTLDGAPRTSATAVTVSVAAGTASTDDFAAVADFTLTIAAGRSSGAATFVLTPVDDAIDEDDETVRVSGTVQNLTVTAGTVTIEDDDARGIEVSATALPVPEGDSRTYTVVLSSQPAGPVTVTPSVSGSADVTVSPSELTFTTQGWDQAQTVTVSAAQDADSGNDEATVSHTVSGGDYGSVTASDVGVTVEDDDDRGVEVSATELSVPEGDSRTYTVVLETQPTGSVTVTPSVSGSADVTVSPSELTFTTQSWDQAQTVTVSTAQDADAANDEATVSHTVSGGDYGSVTASDVGVTVEDDDDRGVEVSATELSVPEGDSRTYTVVLSSQPAGPVTVTPSVSGSADVTVSPATLTFTTQGWDQAQTVTVSAAQDADAANDEATVSHTVSGGDYGSVTASDVGVTVEDDDDRGVEVSATELSVPEGDSRTYTVVLSSQPAGPVTVTPSVSGSADVTVSPSELTFTTQSWDQAQTVTVSAAQDADAANDEATVSHTVSGGDYGSVTVSDVEVTVADDDDRGVEVSSTALSVPEGDSRTYTVVLSSQPDGPVTVTPSVSGSADVTVSPSELTFTTQSWDQAQTVTVSTAQDADAANDEATVSHTVSGGDYGSVTASDVGVTVEDDDDRGVEVSPTALPVPEGDSRTYTVVLESQPAGPVTVTPSVSGSADVTVSPSELTFTTQSWDQAQTVTVSTAQDADAANDEATVSHTVSGGDYGSVTAPAVDVTVSDDETPSAAVILTVLPEKVDEDTGATTIEVTGTLDGAVLTSSTEITVSVSAGTASTEDFAPVENFTLTVAAGQISGKATFSLIPVDDDIDEDDETVRVAGIAQSLAVTAATVTVADDDDRGVEVSATELSVPEGDSRTYTVVLSSQPAGPVTVTPSVSGSADVTVSPSELTFTTQGWDQAQTVTVSAAQDADSGNDEATVSHTVSGGDYGSVTASDVGVTVEDDDDRGVEVSATELSVPEGDSRTYTVVLETQPTGSVTVTPSVSGSADVTVSPSELTFTTQSWDQAQTVTVSTAQDADAANDEATVSHTVSGGDYGSVTASDVGVTVEDDDDRGVEVSATELSVPEGDSRTYTVVLSSQPAGPVTVTPSVSGSADVTVSPATLTFTTQGWDQAQTVTVSAAQDADAANDEAAVSHTVSGGDYGSVTASDVGVTVADDDERGVEVSATELSVPEGDSRTYTVVLSSQPAGPVTVTPSVSGSADVTVSPSELTFTTQGWDQAQTVTVSAAQDADSGNDEATVSHAVSGGDYGSVTAPDVAVTAEDDDERGIEVSATALTVPEGDSRTYTVVLETQPTGSVTVTPSVSGSADVTVSPSELTFTTQSWDQAQTVTVSTAQDADAANDEAAVSHTVSGGDYGSVTASDVGVTVADDDERGVEVSATALSVPEGDSRTYTVVLSSQPAGPVTVTPSVSGSADVTVSPATLTFTTQGWDQAQTVTVSAAQDADSGNDEATVSHTVSGGDYGSVTAPDVAVTAEDDDERGIEVSATALTVPEGDSRTYTVVLETQPTGPVTVTPSVSGSADVTVSPSELTFTTQSWDQAQTVTVSAAQDADSGNDEATVSHTVSGGDYGSVTAPDVAVTAEDDDERGIEVSATALTVPEGDSRTYTVVLETQPTGPVTVTPSVSGSADVTVSPSELTFTTQSWDQAQTVTVSAAQDADSGNDEATVSHTVSGGDYGSVTASDVGVTVEDDDERGVEVSATALSVPEGDSRTYTVVLESQPTGPVTVTPSVSGSADVTVSPSELTFTTQGWDQAQTVTVSAAQDADAANDEATVSHTVSGGDYGSVTASDVGVTVEDDDDRGVEVSATELSVPEGDSRTYTVVLSSQPAGPVTVTPSVSGSADVTVSPSELTFTTQSWDQAQTVTVSAAQDADAANDEATVSHTVSGGDYGSVTASDVEVTVADDDERGVEVSSTALSVPEGDSRTYTVVLSSQPDGSVTVTPSVSGSADVTVSPSELTFTTQSWDQAQTVTVSAAQDADSGNDEATVSHTVSGGDYGSVTAPDVAVTAEDDDERGIEVSATALTVPEGDSRTYTVVLETQPTGPVTVTPSVSGSADVTVSPSELTFTTQSWDQAQTVTVSAAQNADSGNDEATVSHTVSGGDYGSVTASDVGVASHVVS